MFSGYPPEKLLESRSSAASHGTIFNFCGDRKYVLGLISSVSFLLLPSNTFSFSFTFADKKELDGEVLLFLRDVISGIPQVHQRVLHRVLIFIDNVCKVAVKKSEKR